MKQSMLCTMMLAAVVAVGGCKHAASDAAKRPETTAAGGSTAAPPQMAATLDGMAFAGDAVDPGTGKHDSDEITFANGMLHSKGCDQYGFAPAAYTATREGEGTHFVSETSSPKEGRIAWSGTVTGDHLTGTMVWTKEGQQPISYAVTGTKK